MPQVPGPFALRLANNEVSRLFGAEGGLVHADVLGQVHGTEHVARKRLGPPKYEDFSIRVGASMSRGLFDWITASWTAQAPKLNGSLLTLGDGLDIRIEQEFTGALIAETTFPALDATSSDFANLTARFTPAFVKWKKGVGSIPPPGELRPSDWTSSKYRLEINGLDCRRVIRIESFTIKRQVTTASSGSGGTSLSAGTVDFPNLTITLAESGAQSWYDWHDDFVVQGHNDDSRERHGVVTLLSPNLATELARLELNGLGITKLTRLTGSGASRVARVTADLYCEQMKLSRG